ncbi:MAG: hypothetical protein HYY00_03585 [Chloroflexi bacterium]|nr:hypothetical protein [Chloroflexota bacterium]
MPNLSGHLDIALEAACRLAHPTVERHRGSFLLGCTAPDIRIITRGKRDHTHFAPLSNSTLGEGARLMFQQHPRLAGASSLSEPTRAFVAGYIAHLLADEAWIIKLYRPFFGNSEVYTDRAEGSIMDRALQLELDRRVGEDMDGLASVRQALDGAEDGVEVDFLPPELLRQWREFVVEATLRAFTWERLRRMLNRLGLNEDPYALTIVERFLASVPDGLDAIYARVPRERVADFREESITVFLKIAREYLN